jgi:hypothetical protein
MGTGAYRTPQSTVRQRTTGGSGPAGERFDRHGPARPGPVRRDIEHLACEQRSDNEALVVDLQRNDRRVKGAGTNGVFGGNDAASAAFYDDFEAVQPADVAAVVGKALDLPGNVDLTATEIVPTKHVPGGITIARTSERPPAQT